MSKSPFKGGVWSATPTPFTSDYKIDIPSVKRLVAHHIGMGVTGMMLGGTCGEGPWLRDADRETLTRATLEANQGRMRIILQVTDNSAVRVLENMKQAVSWGAEVGIVSAPPFYLNATPARVLGHYQEIARNAPMPMGFYDRGKHGVMVAEENLLELLSEPNIVFVKDSSATESRRAIYAQAHKARPGLVILTGDEFNTVPYIEAGYDGLLLGGAIFNANLAGRIIQAVKSGNLAEANTLSDRMKDLMWRVYGGQKIECWMSGLKELLVQMGIFSTRTNLLGFPLTDKCKADIAAAISGSDGMGFREDLFGKAGAPAGRAASEKVLTPAAS